MTIQPIPLQLINNAFLSFYTNAQWQFSQFIRNGTRTDEIGILLFTVTLSCMNNMNVLPVHEWLIMCHPYGRVESLFW